MESYPQDSNSLARENSQLKARIAELEAQLAQRHSEESKKTTTEQEPLPFVPVPRLSNHDIARYSRHLLLPEIGVQGQLKLRNAAVLVVGAGGLGSPCILYLAAMGIGKLGVVDHDVVEISNLQRQIIHTEARGLSQVTKADSARQTVAAINSQCAIRAYTCLLDSDNALNILADYDVVVDATDNVPTRYLINDACVLLNKPLVSASAIRLEGQLTVYHYHNSPCYRCLFPTPPPPETVTNCSEGGVLGVVPGVLGTLQALETIKVITGQKALEPPTLLLFSAFGSPLFRSVKLRTKKDSCAVCGTNPTITQLQDYPQFCGSQPVDTPLSVNVLPVDQRITCQAYQALCTQGSSPHLLLDVRDKVQYDICRLPNAVNIPWQHLRRDLDQLTRLTATEQPIYVVCRLGNDSQLAVQWLHDQGFTQAKDIIGGLRQWATDVDSDFPVY
ncbi:hypothetical protein H4R34_002439 [Dimargaris verticillata]|uniref:Needs CLA4 to survive protein 3 n=1 Tax=Dimargaris verticillata TaxID=2761393 RepID=A0A9W8B2K8_9FUNG|nr:hypothetical protein H4R34_002439 [Dimargaris verticillata]